MKFASDITLLVGKLIDFVYQIKHGLDVESSDQFILSSTVSCCGCCLNLEMSALPHIFFQIRPSNWLSNQIQLMITFHNLLKDSLARMEMCIWLESNDNNESGLIGKVEIQSNFRCWIEHTAPIELSSAQLDLNTYKCSSLLHPSVTVTVYFVPIYVIYLSQASCLCSHGSWDWKLTEN